MEAFIDMKKLILVTSPPACGKTFISKQVAKALPNCVYLDKDTMIQFSSMLRSQRRSEMMSILTIFALSLQRKMQSSSLSG